MSGTNSPGQEIATLSDEEKELVELAKLNKGFERDELTIPFLKILQPLSPYVQEGNPQYVQGARPGMFYNTASNKFNDGKVGIITCVITHQKNFTQWVPRAAGGGLVKNWGDDEGWRSLCEDPNAFNPVTREGHNIVKARAFTIFNIDTATGEFDPSVMLFAGTNTKTASAWSTLLNNDYIRMSNNRPMLAPHYYFTYLLTTELTTNNKGSWYSARVRQNIQDGKRVRLRDVVNGETIWQAAVSFSKSMSEGTIKAEDMANDNMPTHNDNDEIPF